MTSIRIAERTAPATVLKCAQIRSRLDVLEAVSQLLWIMDIEWRFGLTTLQANFDAAVRRLAQ